MRLRQLFAAMIAAVAVGSLAGCPEKVAPRSIGVGKVDWPFRPATLSFHPLTRVDSADVNTMLRVLVEFRDEGGDPVKAIGLLEIEASSPGVETRNAPWTFDLSDPELNERLFDPVTQTYRLRIENPWIGPAPTAGSEVTLSGSLACGEERLFGTVTVRW